ncbi:hypothetical protein HFN89_03960 [Rhizobium laguerreae]|nr:hypothetical protein [Rhizobium laguerreae]
MFRTLRSIWRLSLVVALVSSASYLYPAARLGFRYLSAPDDPVAAAEVRMESLAGDDFEDEVRTALAEKDPELARSMVAVAKERGYSLAPELIVQIEEAEKFSVTETAKQAWSGLTSGNTDSPAAFAAALAADMTVVGDAKDLYGEYLKYPEWDELTVALSSAGIVAAGATYASMLSALPAKAGVTLLKNAKKADKIPGPLLREMRELASGSVDVDAVRQATKSAAKLDATEAVEQARRAVRPEVLQKLVDAGANFGTVARRHGYRASMDTLKLANSTDDIRRMGKLSSRFGDDYRATIRFARKAGSLTMHVGEFLLKTAWWLICLASWAVGAAILVFEAILTVLRFLRGSRALAAQ